MSNIDDFFPEDKVSKKDIEQNDRCEISESEQSEQSEQLINTDEGRDISGIPVLIGGNVHPDYKQVVDRIVFSYKKLPEIDYDKTYEELSQLNVKSQPTPTLQAINQQLQRVQGYKDRLSEIYKDVTRSYLFKKRAVNILSDALGRFSDAKSADKRKSDCVFMLSDFHRDLAEIEALSGTCDHILKNLDSFNNNLSRQITLIQSQLKIMDIGKGTLPDMDFSASSTDLYGTGDSTYGVGDSIFTEPFDPSKSISANEESF
jgi:hypothetical protein